MHRAHTRADKAKAADKRGRRRDREGVARRERIAVAGYRNIGFGGCECRENRRVARISRDFGRYRTAGTTNWQQIGNLPETPDLRRQK
jgi:hypothetical protein